MRSIRTGAAFLELGELASVAGEVERRIENMRASGGTVDDSVLGLLRAAVEAIGRERAADARVESESEATSGRFGGEQSPPRSVGVPEMTHPPRSVGVPEMTHPPRSVGVPGVGVPETEPLRLAERKAPMLGDLLNDLAASHSRLEGLALGSSSGAMDEMEAKDIGVEGRDLRRLGRFFGIEALEAIGAAVECAAPAMGKSDDAARRAVPRLRAVLHAFVEFTHALGSSSVVRRDLTRTCEALKRLGAGDGAGVAALDEGATWTDVLDADAGRVVSVLHDDSDQHPVARWGDVPEFDAVAADAAARVEASVPPAFNRPVRAPDAFLHPLANVMTETARVVGMAGSIPGEQPDPVETVRAVNRVADDLRRAAEGMKGTVMASRGRPLGTLLAECTTLVSNVAGQMGCDIRAEARGARLEIDDAVMSRLRDPLLAIVHHLAAEAAGMPADSSGKGGPATMWISSEGEGSQVCIRVMMTCRADRLPPDSSGALHSARGAVESMAGSVEFTADPVEGPAVVVRVPMNLAFMDAMIVRIGETTCAVPTAQVEEVIMPGAGQIATIGSRRAVQLRRATVPLVDGRALLGACGANESARLVVVVRAGGRRVAIRVDRAMGRQEIVVRPMDRTLAGAGPIWSAASIADGSSALVLDVPALVRATAAAYSSSAAA